MPLTPTTAAPSSGVPVYFSPNVSTPEGGPGYFPSDFPGNITSITASDTHRRIFISTNTHIYQLENPELDPASAFYSGVSFALSGVPVIRDFSFNRDGTQIIIADVNAQVVRQLTLPSPFDLLGAVQTSSVPIFIDSDMGGIAYAAPDPAGIFQAFFIYYDEPPFGGFILARYNMSDPSNVNTAVLEDQDNTTIIRPYVLNFDHSGYTFFVSNPSFTNFLSVSQLQTAWEVQNPVVLSQFPIPASTIASFSVEGLRQYNAIFQSGSKQVTAFSSSFLMPTG